MIFNAANVKLYVVFSCLNVDSQNYNLDCEHEGTQLKNLLAMKLICNNSKMKADNLFYLTALSFYQLNGSLAQLTVHMLSFD